jgi:hypothetical protein
VQTATFTATGDLQAQAAQIAGTVTVNRMATGALQAQDATISGEATSMSIVVPPVRQRTGGGGMWLSAKEERELRLFVQALNEDDELLIMVPAVLLLDEAVRHG